MKERAEIQVWFHGLVLDTLTQSPVVILRDSTGSINIPIWIGMAEATSIATALKEIPSYRPLTHDLLKNVITIFNGVVEAICITKIEDGTFFAEMRLRSKDNILYILDCRPSDGIATAVRVNCPIYVSEEVAKQSSVKLESVSENPSEDQNIQTEESRPHDAEQKFLTIQKLDKDKWKEILEKLSPEDFKHKH